MHVRMVGVGAFVAMLAAACGDDGASPDGGIDTGVAMDGGADADAAMDAAPPPEIEVSYDHGTVVGRTIDGVHTFLGLPYAAPPVGTMRWRPPGEVTPWTEPRDAAELGPVCPQINVLLGRETPDGEEDCLRVNVFSPDVAPAAPMPVFVWFHGGAFIFGSGGTDAGRLAAISQTVVVTVNYRLDLLGFMAHPELTAEGGGASGNYGLMDQRASLEWVRDHVAAFGGDPDRVTIAGESAGGISVALHGVSPGSSGLFHRAIVQSGPPTLLAIPELADAETLGDGVANRLGCTDPAGVLSCMRAASIEELVIPVDRALSGGVFYQSALPFSVPIVDGAVLVEQPTDAYEAGRFERVPFVVGSTVDEGTLFHSALLSTPVADESEYRAALGRAFPTAADEVAAMYPVASYPDANAALTAVTGDLFACGTRRHARQIADAGGTVHLYAFAGVPTGILVDSLMLGAFHAADLVYLFDTNGGSLGAPRMDERDIVDAMQGYWTRFTATGDPNGGGSLVWPAYQTATDEHMNLASPPAVGTGYRAAACDFWMGLALP